MKRKQRFAARFYFGKIKEKKNTVLSIENSCMLWHLLSCVVSPFSYVIFCIFIRFVYDNRALHKVHKLEKCFRSVQIFMFIVRADSGHKVTITMD